MRPGRLPGEHRDTTFTQPGFECHVRILLVKGGKIKLMVVVAEPEAYARIRIALGRDTTKQTAQSVSLTVLRPDLR